MKRIIPFVCLLCDLLHGQTEDIRLRIDVEKDPIAEAVSPDPATNTPTLPLVLEDANATSIQPEANNGFALLSVGRGEITQSSDFLIGCSADALGGSNASEDSFAETELTISNDELFFETSNGFTPTQEFTVTISYRAIEQSLYVAPELGPAVFTGPRAEIDFSITAQAIGSGQASSNKRFQRIRSYSILNREFTEFISTDPTTGQAVNPFGEITVTLSPQDTHLRLSTNAVARTNSGSITRLNGVAGDRSYHTTALAKLGLQIFISSINSTEGVVLSNTKSGFNYTGSSQPNSSINDLFHGKCIQVTEDEVCVSIPETVPGHRYRLLGNTDLISPMIRLPKVADQIGTGGPLQVSFGRDFAQNPRGFFRFIDLDFE